MKGLRQIIRGLRPLSLKAEIHLLFGTSLKAANLRTFLKF